MKKSNRKFVYAAPRVDCNVIEIGHSLLATSIIKYNQEVVIDRQDGGIEEDMVYHTWE